MLRIRILTRADWVIDQYPMGAKANDGRPDTSRVVFSAVDELPTARGITVLCKSHTKRATVVRDQVANPTTPFFRQFGGMRNRKNRPLGCRAIRYGGNRIDAYVDFAEPGGINTASRLISPRATRSRPSINSLWCAAGSNPQYRHHSMRLRRKERRLSNRSAANSGEISDVPESGPFMEGHCEVRMCRFVYL